MQRHPRNSVIGVHKRQFQVLDSLRNLQRAIYLLLFQLLAHDVHAPSIEIERRSIEQIISEDAHSAPESKREIARYLASYPIILK